MKPLGSHLSDDQLMAVLDAEWIERWKRMLRERDETEGWVKSKHAWARHELQKRGLMLASHPGDRT